MPALLPPPAALAGDSTESKMCKAPPRSSAMPGLAMQADMRYWAAGLMADRAARTSSSDRAYTGHKHSTQRCSQQAATIGIEGAGVQG